MPAKPRMPAAAWMTPLLMQIGSLMGGGADEDTASQLEKLQADRDPYAAGAAAELGKSLLEFDEANEKRQQNIVNDLDEKIARGDAGVKLPRNALPAARSWPG